MKSSSLTLATTVAAIAFTTLAAISGPPTITAAAKAAPTAAKQRAEKPGAASHAKAIVAKSEFILPRKTTDGRDPFFPNSPRPYASEIVAKPASDSSVLDNEFSLNGVSGSPERPLAIINNTTFTTGEENEVIIKGKRIKIRCVEINMTVGTVLFEYGGARRQLKLAPH
jgi:hypothetical protein